MTAGEVGRDAGISKETATPRWMTVTALVAPSLFCALILLSGLGVRALWADEAYSALAATKEWPDLLTLVTQSNDAVHAVYYALLHVWLDAFGVTPITLRLPSVLFMTAACMGVTLIGWQMSRLLTGVLAGFTLAMLPVTMDYGTEARSYALSVALVTWTSWAFARQLTNIHPRALGWVLYGALLTVTGLVFMYGWLIAVAHAVTLVLSPGARARLWPPALGTVLASAAMLAPFWWLAVGQAGQVGWIRRDTSAELEAVATFTFDRSAATLWWPFLGFVLLMMWATWTVLRGSGAGGSERLLVMLAWPWSLVPGFALVAASFLKPTFTDRYIVFTAPAVALLLGLSFKQLRLGWRIVGLSCLVAVAAASYTWLFIPAGRDGWGTKEAILREKALPGDGVLFSPDAYSNVSRYTGLPEGMQQLSPSDLSAPSEQLLTTVWVVPFDCVLPEDATRLKDAGYQPADAGAGACTVQRFTRAQP